MSPTAAYADTHVRYRRALAARRRYVLSGSFVILLQSLSMLPIPLLLRFAIDQAIPQRSTPKLMLTAIGIVALTFVNRVASLASQFLLQNATKHATAVVRRDIAEVFFNTPFERLGDLNPATAQARMVGNVDRIEEQFDTALRVFVPNAVMSIGMFALLFTMDPLLTVVCATIAPLIMVSIRLFRPSLLQAVHDHQDAVDALGRSTLLAVRAQALYRSRGTAADEHRALDGTIDQLMAASTRRVNRNNVFQATQGTLIASAAGATLVIGGEAVISGRITLGALLSFFAGFTLLRTPISALSSCTPKFVAGRLSSARVDEFLNAHRPPTAPRPIGGSQTPDREPTGTTSSVEPSTPKLSVLALERVSFAYAGGAPVVADLSITLRPGRVVGLCGPNGSGKSTVLGLLLGLLEPASGRAVANGVDVGAFGLANLRRQVGYAAQHPAFLPGTVADNIAYGRPGLDRSDVEAAIDAVEARPFVEALTHAADTPLGDNAERLSGGERQRLALARALVGSPPVVIFDEPNNHLPDATIERIVARIIAVPTPPAVLLISHDRNVLAIADDVVELPGREVGLLAQGPSESRDDVAS